MPGDDIFVEWDEKYSVGIQLIDDQHKELITLTNTLYKGCLTGADMAKTYFLGTVHGAVEYVKYHFTMEEKLLAAVAYPVLEAHKNEHRSFVKQILQDVKSFQEGKQFVPNTFVRFLRDWILSHIAVMDKKYMEYIQENISRNALDAILLDLKKLCAR
ncbi:MAG: bacteriohemerythrin [Spirochaetaceae bacterium]|jgi:hemerythrin|nr:bacteriohemerythrin [Spirochaetaceae bacterium]